MSPLIGILIAVAVFQTARLARALHAACRVRRLERRRRRSFELIAGELATPGGARQAGNWRAWADQVDAIRRLPEAVVEPW